ncbi:MAG: MATE family efflux transporter, partial [Pseudomonadota bacterium]
MPKFHRDADVSNFCGSTLKVASFSTLAMAVDYSFQMVDIFWVARIGPGAATALAVISTALYLIFAANEIVGVSSGAVIAQCHGRGDNRHTGHIILQTLCLKLALGIGMVAVFALCMVFILPHYGLKAQELLYAQEYAVIIWLSLLLIPLYATMMTCLRVFGMASTSTAISLGALVANFILNPLFIFGFGPIPAMGIAGAAWATIFAQTLTLIVSCFFLIRQPIRIFCRDYLTWWPSHYKKVVLVGLPMGGAMLLYNLEQIMMTAIVSNLTDSVVSDGFSIGLRIFGLTLMMHFGMSMGVSVTCGHALGRNDHDLIARSMRRLCIILAGYLAVWSLTLILFATPIIAAFGTTGVTLTTGVCFLQMMAIA